MKKFTNFVRPLIIACVSVLLITVLAWQPSSKGCHKINAKGKGFATSFTPTGATTVADIIGGGIINGSTTAVFTNTEFDMSTGDQSFVGTLEVITKHGTLSFDVVGELNVNTGAFTSDAIATDGSGRFNGATGNLFLDGQFNPANGSFTEDISGEICLNPGR